MNIEIKRDWIELGIAIVLSIIFIYVGLLFMFFSVPLYVVYKRHGKKYYGIAAAAVTAVHGLLTFYSVRKIGLDASAPLFSLFSMMFFGSTLGGIGFLAVDFPKVRKKINKILIATLGFGILLLPLGFAWGTNDSMKQDVKNVIREVPEQLGGYLDWASMSGISEEDNVIVVDDDGYGIDVDKGYEILQEMMLRHILFGFFLFLTASWKICESIYNLVSRTRGKRLILLHLDHRLVWGVIVPLAMILADIVLDLGPVIYPAWNCLLIMLFTFGLQGVGIIQHFLEKYRISRFARMAITVGAVFIALYPGLNLIVYLGIPGIGITEIWVKFRERSLKDESNTESGHE